MQSVEPPGVLHERALPRDRQGEEQRVEPSVVDRIELRADGTFGGGPQMMGPSAERVYLSLDDLAESPDVRDPRDDRRALTGRR
jgi:hypothetical protein